MTETPSHENMLLRESDMTLHRLQDASGQYVHMVEASNADLRQDAPSKPKS